MLLSLPFEIEGARVLDAFAGSGSLALEALSRGAAYALLVDSNRGAIECLKRNIATTRLTAQEATLRQITWPQAAGLLAEEPFDLLFFDPPYKQAQIVPQILHKLNEKKLLSPGALVVWEQAPEDLGKFELPLWELLKERTWGNCAVALWQLPHGQ